MFDRAASGREAARFLAELRQGDRSVTDFSIEFRTLAAECRWNSEAQWDMFFHGLADYVKDEIYTGVTHVAGWFGQSGYSGGCQITAERSASTPSFGGQ